jgi:ABC-type transport system involved in multi-copper enzyme maturation permease subunit
MIAGPVCHAELVRIARRRRTYVWRFVFGMVVLGLIGMNYLSLIDWARAWYDPIPRTVSIHQLSRFGQMLFASLMMAQAILVIGLTPGLVADAITDERRRKTLHYLLTSRLGSVEIVLGKLAARLVNVAAFVALVLPIASLLTLFGGIDPQALLLGDAAILATAYFLAGLSMLVSVLSRRPREAVGAAYVLTAFWLFGPVVIEPLLPEVLGSGSPALPWLQAAYEWLWPASPLMLVTNAQGLFMGGPDALKQLVGWMIGSQLVYGTLLIALATWQLRPAYRRQEGRAGRRPRRLARTWRWFPRPPCGDDPVFWKEARVAPSGAGWVRRLTKLFGTLLVGSIVIGLLYGSKDAFHEVWANGYGYHGYQQYFRRMGFNFGLRFGWTGLFALWMLWLGSLTAASLTSEREQDTWISLLATPLEGREILRGKILGALWATRGFPVLLALLWLLGLASGSVHPLALPVVLPLVALETWFVVALGTYSSLYCQTTWRAQAWTQGVVIGPHVCCMMPLPSLFYLIGFGMFSYADFAGLLELPRAINTIDFSHPGEWIGALLVLAYVVFCIVGYVTAAFLLTRGAFNGFDTVADRPRATWRTARFVRSVDAFQGGAGETPT